jgi:hypothetical protein
VVVDDWKYPIFHRHLSASGWPFEELPGVTPDTRMFKVTVPADQVYQLERVVRAASKEAEAHRKYHHQNQKD